MSTVYAKAQQLLKLRNLGDGTLYRSLRFIKRFEAFWAPLSVEQGERSHVLEYLLGLRNRGLSASTTKSHQAALFFLFTTVLDRPEVVRNIPWPKLPQTLPDIWAPAELERLFQAIPQFNYQTFAMALYGTGMRISELCTLHVSDIDGQRLIVPFGRSRR